MTAHTRQVDFLSIKSVFKCPNCGHEVTLNPGGTMGVYFAVGLLATLILSFIFWGSGGGYDVTTTLKTLALLAVFTSPVWWAAIKTRLYPVTGTRAATEDEDTEAEYTGAESTAESDPLQKGITSLDKRSPFQAFWIVIVCVVLFLGAATLIGWVNFTFFDDKLFG